MAQDPSQWTAEVADGLTLERLMKFANKVNLVFSANVRYDDITSILRQVDPNLTLPNELVPLPPAPAPEPEQMGAEGQCQAMVKKTKAQCKHRAIAGSIYCSTHSKGNK